MPLGLGITKGASYVNDWEKDIDRVYQRAEYAAKIQTEKERKTAYYAELLKKGHATNPRTELELNGLYKGLNDKLATFFTENPNFETDIDAMQKFRDIQDQYLNNDVLRRDIQVGQEFEKLKNAVATKQITKNGYEENMARYREYIDPANAGKDNPFVFVNYQQKTTEDILKELKEASAVKVSDKTQLDPVSHTYYRNETVPYEDSALLVQQRLSNPDEREVMMKGYQDLLDESLKKGTDLSKTVGFRTIEEYYTGVLDKMNKKDIMPLGQDLNYSNEIEYNRQRRLKNYELGPDYYAQNVLSALNNIRNTKDENGNVSSLKSTQADNASVAFTKAQKLNIPFMITPSDSVYMDVQGGGLPLLDRSLMATMQNVTEHVNLGDNIAYAKGTFKITVPLFDENKSDANGNSIQDPGYISEKELTEKGFVSGQMVNSPLFDKGGNQIGVKKGREWSGTGFFKEIHNDNTKFNYNRLFTNSGDVANKISTNYGQSPVNVESGKISDITAQATPGYSPELSRQSGENMYIVVGPDGQRYAKNDEGRLFKLKSE